MPIIAVPSSPDDELILAFEENEFDIAGLADLAVDDNAVQLALRELYLILVNGTEPRRSNRTRLARVLLAMMTVARNDYAGSGHQEYWPFLFDRIEDAIGKAGNASFASLRTQPQQLLLGRWFRFALDAFGYTIPEEGQTYVGPIVFHAGIPRSSLIGAMQLVDTAVRQFGQSAVNLPYDLRAQLARNHFPPLHRNIERLLVSQLTGASQLWSSLARIIVAWQQHGDCTEELKQLPAALDPQDVRQALPRRDGSTVTQRLRTALPQLRFDPATGEVRLTFSSSASSDWEVTETGAIPIELRWQQTHLGLTAEVLAPPPEEINIAQRGGDGICRTLVTRLSHWPGIWFHASNGNLEDGATIDTNGLEPGRWYVLFEETPTRWNVPSVYRVQLKWSYFSGNHNWTAWAVEVPQRSSDRPRLECYVDDNCFHVPLTRRPGPQIEVCSSPVASATSAAGEAVQVFAEAPVVRLRRDRSLAATLLRVCGGEIETLRRDEIPPEQDWRIPVDEPGVFQLREARGVGRILLHFTVIPGAGVSGPIYDVQREHVAVEFRCTDATGRILADDEEQVLGRNGIWRIEQSTVEPLLECEWHWHSQVAEPLTFRWTVEGLRWRVLRLTEEAARWTRVPVFVSPSDVEKHDAQLEIQVPSASELAVNEQTYSAEILGRRAICAGLSLSLLPYGEIVHVSVDDEEPRTAVIKSDRPSIDSFEVLCDGESVLVTWKAKASYTNMVLLAWGPRQLNMEPEQFALSDEGIELSCSELPGKVCSLAIGRLVRTGFTGKILQLAAIDSNPSVAQSLILNLKTGNTTIPNYPHPTTWTELLHCLTVDRLNGTLRGREEITTLLSEVDGDGQSEIGRYLELDSVLADSQSPFDEQWRTSIRHALAERITLVATQNPPRILGTAHPNDLLIRLLRLGVAIGQTCPQKWLATDSVIDDGDCFYPFALIRDLWLLGTCEFAEFDHDRSDAQNGNGSFREHQLAAAHRVWKFLNSHELYFALHLLPMLQNTAYVHCTGERHRHSVSLPARQIQDASDFLDALGLETVALDCHATCDDQFWNTPSANNAGVWHSPEAARVLRRHRHKTVSHEYSLLWDHEEQQWYIERPRTSTPTCCRTPTLTVPAIRMDNLIDALGLRQVLACWAKLDPPGNDHERSPTRAIAPCWAVW